jgi:type I restriction enzyme S subunit
MSSEVLEHRLDSICLLVVDCPHATPKWTDSGVVVLRNQNIKGGRLDLSSPSFTDEEHYLGRVKRAVPQVGDIVITREAPMGDVCQIPAGLKCCLGQRQVLLRPDPKKVDSRFLLYALQSPYIQHQIGWNEGTGSTVSNLRIPVLEALSVPTPELAVQREVAETLGAIDDRITLLRETNTTLEAIAQALFPDSFEESELGAVPKGWRVTSIYDVAKVIYGAPFASKQFKPLPPGKPLVRIRDLKDERPGVYTEEMHLKGYLIQPGDITVGMDGEFRAYLWGGEEAWLNQRVCVFQPVNGANSVFLRSSISPLLAAVEASETATTVIHLGKNDIDRFKVFHPGNLLLESFAWVTTPIYQRVIRNKQMIQNLAGLRDTLLPRLISGQILISDVQIETQAA